MLKDYIALIRKLPPILNLTWFAMHVGLVFLFAALIQQSAPLTLVGIAPILLGVVISWCYRGPISSRFFGGVLLGLIGSLVALVIIGPICLIAFLVIGLIDGFEIGYLLRFGQLLLVMCAYVSITGIAGYKTVQEERADSPEPELL